MQVTTGSSLRRPRVVRNRRRVDVAVGVEDERARDVTSIGAITLRDRVVQIRVHANHHEVLRALDEARIGEHAAVALAVRTPRREEDEADPLSLRLREREAFVERLPVDLRRIPRLDARGLRRGRLVRFWRLVRELGRRATARDQDGRDQDPAGQRFESACMAPFGVASVAGPWPLPLKPLLHTRSPLVVKHATSPAAAASKIFSPSTSSVAP